MTIAFDYTLLIQFLNILVLLILLNMFLFKPVLRAINKRETSIGSLFGKVQKVREETEKLEKSYEEVIKEKRKPILEHRDTTLSKAHSESTGIIEKARKELSDELAKVKSQIEGESKKVFDILKGDVERLGTEAAEKILKRSV
jgi:F-type H+-transporting ATPase subunit b